jgi:Zn-dependent protease
MAPTQTGSFRLFRVAGITVYLHWSWLLLAYFLIVLRPFGKDFNYQTAVRPLVECATIFGIVLLHEFGHALACRSVGGIAEYIVLWPLGGVAYVAPPPRPGPTLWSVAAGPLVNLLFLPVTLLALYVADGLRGEWLDLYRFVFIITIANLLQLFFNLLPIYPLDGGQILQAILWFFLGRGRSLLIVSGIGVLAGVGLIAYVLRAYRDGDSFWWVLAGFHQARLLLDRMHLPRHADTACPSCGEAPLQGDYWLCDECGESFDMFACRSNCPHCNKNFAEVICPDCRWRHPLTAWQKATAEGAESAEKTQSEEDQTSGVS